MGLLNRLAETKAKQSRLLRGDVSAVDGVPHSHSAEKEQNSPGGVVPVSSYEDDCREFLFLLPAISSFWGFEDSDLEMVRAEWMAPAVIKDVLAAWKLDIAAYGIILPPLASTCSEAPDFAITNQTEEDREIAHALNVLGNLSHNAEDLFWLSSMFSLFPPSDRPALLVVYGRTYSENSNSCSESDRRRAANQWILESASRLYPEKVEAAQREHRRRLGLRA